MSFEIKADEQLAVVFLDSVALLSFINNAILERNKRQMFLDLLQRGQPACEEEHN